MTWPLACLALWTLLFLSACRSSSVEGNLGADTGRLPGPMVRTVPLSPLPPTPRDAVGQKIPPSSLSPSPVSLSATPSPTVGRGEGHFAVPTPYMELYRVAAQVWGEARLIRRIRIPRLSVDSQVVPVGWYVTEEGVLWESPGPYVGWAVNSVPPGESGQIVLYGHNNIEGGIFRNLYRLQAGDIVVLITGERDWSYQVTEVRIVAVTDARTEREIYQAYLLQQEGETRLVLISCYPPDNNTHRVLVFARPRGNPMP